MRSPTLPFLVLALLGLFSLGASCNGGPEATQGKAASGPKIEKLDRVETGSLTEGERRTWVELVNEQLSPCGEPVSVAQCVAEARSCSACVPAARYLVRL